MPDTELLKSPELETRSLPVEARLTQVVEEAVALAGCEILQTASVVVKDQQSLDALDAFLTNKVAPAIADGHAEYDPMVEKSHASWQEALRLRHARLDRLEWFWAAGKKALARYDQEQKEKQAAEDRRLREEAEARARADRDAEVARAKAEQERLQAEAAARLEKEIEQAEKEGRTEDALRLCSTPITTEVDGLAEAIAREPIHVVVPVSTPTYRAPSSFTPREEWDFEVVSLDELIEAAAVNKSLRQYLMVNEKVASAIAKTAKSTMNIPGLRSVRGSGMAKKRAQR